MLSPLVDRIRSDEMNIPVSGSRIQRSNRLEYARGWGPCILGIEQAVRGPLSSMGPVVFCAAILSCVHETELENQGIGSFIPTLLSGNDQEKFSQVVQSDPCIAWILRIISSEAADGARCSMGVLEHTTAASMIKEAIAAGVNIRGIRVSASCDIERFRQFLYEAFPMIDDITVYPRTTPVMNQNTVAAAAAATTTTTTTAVTSGQYLSPPSPQTSPSSPSIVCCTSSGIPPAVCVASILAQSVRDSMSRQLLYRQRQTPSPPTRSPLSKPMHSLRKRDNFSQSASSFFNGPLFRSRSCSEEDAHRTSPMRCVAYAGSEFGEAHCGLVSQTETVPMDMYDFYDDDSSMVGLTSPKRIRVVPCSPPLSTVFSCEDTLPCVCPAAQNANSVNHSNGVSQTVDSFDSSSFHSNSLFVSPPPCSTSTSTSVPVFRPMFGVTNIF